MSSITVRAAVHEDVPVMAGIIRKLGWFPYVDNESEAATEMRVRLQLELCDTDDSHTVLVAEDEEGAASGYISVHWLPYLLLTGPEGYISEIFVKEEARGKGIGRALMNDVKELAITKNCSRLMLLANRTREAQERDFYIQLGFEEREQMANFVLNLT
jgi:GNAT superfamily N-acetyltransferase